MHGSQVEKTVFRFYDLVWKALIPFLRYNKRLAEGFDQRKFTNPNLPKADLWIQAASAGEAYLAWEILKQLPRRQTLRILLTTQTSQGMDILTNALKDLSGSTKSITAHAAYLPFDSPAIMVKAAQHIQPNMVVLLETEIWPGLLYTMKQMGCRVAIVNGRMTPKSLNRYMIWRSLWYRIGPEKILAVSPADAARFAKLFGPHRVEVMPNIKFDRLSSETDPALAPDDLDRILAPEISLVVLGSVRQPEENDLVKIISEILERQPQTTIGLFPRHMQRLDYWQQTLNRLGVSWMLRSRLKTPAPEGTVLLWDVFGELNTAFGKATTAFIGGSLAPLGGQNFLEPLIHGVAPVIGPHWDNFRWVGPEIMDLGIVHQASTWKEVADLLIAGIMNPRPKDTVAHKAKTYIKDRQGGTRMACRLINEYLETGKNI